MNENNFSISMRHVMMRLPGFEPELSAFSENASWEADVLTKLDYSRKPFEMFDFPDLRLFPLRLASRSMRKIERKGLILVSYALQ